MKIKTINQNQTYGHGLSRIIRLLKERPAKFDFSDITGALDKSRTLIMQTNPAPVTDYIGLISLLVAVASLLASIVAVVFAKRSVSLAERIAQREHDEWAQRKWFDLYLEAAEALDTLDYLRVKYPNPEYKQGTEERAKDWNEMMFKMRAVGRTAFVFPKNPTVTAFIDSCKFRDSENPVLNERYKEMFEAVEGLRGKALVNPSVLDYDPQRKP